MPMLPFDVGKLRQICRENDSAMLGVFGSVARGEATDFERTLIQDAVIRQIEILPRCSEGVTHP